jgi:glycosyltransferase involved in cell wall biosynthesis
MVNAPIVSVNIPTYNKAEYLNLTLASYVNQTCAEFELIIVDDGSTDETRRVVREYQNRIPISYVCQSNRGISAARNMGLEKSQGEIIIFTDDDRIAHPHFIQEHIDEHVGGIGTGNDNKVVIGRKGRVLSIWQKGRLPLEEADFLSVLHREPALIGDFNSYDVLHLIQPGDLETRFHDAMARFRLDDARDNYQYVIAHYSESLTDFSFGWALATGGNMSVPAKYVEKAGLFDENYAGWGMDDTDMSYRLYLNGATFVVHNEAINFHQVHPLGDKWPQYDQEKRYAALHRNITHFCQKHDTLESYLFGRRPKLNLIDANTLLQKVVAINDPMMLQEFTSLYRDWRTFASLGRELR